MDTTAKEAATRLLVGLGLKGDDLAAATDAVTRTRIKAPSDVFVPSPFKVTELITAVNTTALALCDLISRQRIGRSQELEVDAEHATGTLTTHFSYIIDGLTAPESVAVLAEHIGYSDPLRLWKGIMNNTWKLKDGKYIVFFMRPADTPAKLASALGFTDSEIDQLVPLLDTVSGRAEFARQTAAKIESWDSAALEARIIKLNATAAIVGLPESEFKASDHGKLAQTWPMVEIIAEPGSWKPTPWTRILNPLHGILHGVKVLELTRVLLGPRGGCLLSALGATVVRVNSPLIEEGFVAVDVNIGKRSVHLDMKDDADREKFAGLMRECDVFISNNAFGVMGRLGFGFKDACGLIAGRDRGIIYAQANAFGFDGSLASAGGYEHLGHFITGIGITQGGYHLYDGPMDPKKPAAVPINVLDICTGHSVALGAIEALRRRATHGGSFLVQTSLLQVGMFMQSMGLHPKSVVDKAWKNFIPEPATMDPERPFGGGAFGYFLGYQQLFMKAGYPGAFKKEYMLSIKDCPWLPKGRTLHLMKPALKMSETPVVYRTSTRPVGYDKEIGFPKEVEEMWDLVGEGEVKTFAPGIGRASL